MSGFVPFLLILFALAIILRIDFFFSIFYLFAGVYLLSRFWVGRTRKGLTVESHFIPRAFIGDSVTVALTLKNSSWLPIPWVELIESLPAELTTPWQPELIRLQPNDTRTLSYSFTPRKRGYYAIGPLKIATGDVFGIVPHYRMEIPHAYLTVYPRVVSLNQLGLPTHSPLVVLPSIWPLFEDASRVTGVRSYEPGDSPRNIHWTASASAGQLLVKRYQPAVARDTLIFLDLNADSYAQRFAGPELAIVAAASIANHIIIREKLPVGLATEAHDPLPGAKEVFYLPPRSERAHLVQILEVLARITTTADTSFIAQLRRERARVAYGTTLVVITGQESAELYDTLLMLHRAGFAIALVIVQAARDNRAALNPPRGITIYRVWYEADLETKL